MITSKLSQFYAANHLKDTLFYFQQRTKGRVYTPQIFHTQIVCATEYCLQDKGNRKTGTSIHVISVDSSVQACGISNTNTGDNTVLR